MNTYKVYLDNNKLIYYSGADDKRYIISSPVLTMEMNKSGSFEFTIPFGNVCYEDEIRPLKTLIKITKNDSEFWRGRVISTEKDFYLNRKIVCEGELGFLNDYSYLSDNDYSKDPISLNSLIYYIVQETTNLGNKDRCLYYGMGNKEPHFSSYTYNGALDTVNKNSYELLMEVVSKYPVFLRMSKTRYDKPPFSAYKPEDFPNGVGVIEAHSLEDMGLISGQTIEFGKNLIDLNDYLSADSIVNRVYPLGKKKSNGDRYSVTRGVPYKYPNETGYESNLYGFIDYTPSIKLYGYIMRNVIFENLSKSSDLEKAAIDYMKKTQILTNKIEISAVDLSSIGVNVDEFEIGQFVRIKSKPHGIDTNTICSKIVIDFENPENNQYTFGLTFKTLSEQEAIIGKTSTQAYDAAIGFVYQEPEQ